MFEFKKVIINFKYLLKKLNIMGYMYAFSRFSGNDKIFKYETKKFSKGDLLTLGDEYFIYIGDDVSFKELYSYILNINEENFNIKEKNFLSKNSINIINFIVGEFFTTYKKVIPLFLRDDIENILKRTKKKTGTSSFYEIIFNGYSYKLKENKTKGQQLIVFPDLWSIKNIIYEDLYNYNVKVLHGYSTKKQKVDTFWNIRNGTLSTLITTYSQIFQNWKNLKKISVIDPHKWYYKNQQDPRYNTIDIINKMGEVYNAKIDLINDLRI